MVEETHTHFTLEHNYFFNFTNHHVILSMLKSEMGTRSFYQLL